MLQIIQRGPYHVCLSYPILALRSPKWARIVSPKHFHHQSVIGLKSSFFFVLVELAFIPTRCKPVSHEEVSLLRDDLERYQCLAPAYQRNATGGNT